MSGHTALILGAGFSKAAGGPLLRELLQPDLLEESEADYACLTALLLLGERLASRVSPNNSTIEDVFTDVWREAKTGGGYDIEGERFEAEDLLRNLSIHLASTCGKLHLRRSSTLWHLYTDFLQGMHDEAKTLTVVSFNYDPLVEQCLDDIGRPFIYGRSPDLVFDNSARNGARYRRKADIAVLKLHGSANWGVCRGCRKADRENDVVTAFEKPFVGTRNRSCPFCGDRYLDSGIVPPIIGKAAEVQHLTGIWKEARRRLRRAREVVVIGYSMPSTDLEAVSLLREVSFLGKRPRITVACGRHGAPSSYRSVFPKFEDTKLTFEDFAASFPT